MFSVYWPLKAGECADRALKRLPGANSAASQDAGAKHRPHRRIADLPLRRERGGERERARETILTIIAIIIIISIISFIIISRTVITAININAISMTIALIMPIIITMVVVVIITVTNIIITLITCGFALLRALSCKKDPGRLCFSCSLLRKLHLLSKAG